MNRLTIATLMLSTLMPFAAVAQAAATPTSDPLLVQRLATVPRTRPWPISWFQPQERIAGSVTRGPVPPAHLRTIAPEALAEARAYVMARGTQAFLVWHKGRLEHAEFAQGTNPAEPLNTYYMHLPVLNLLYGVALRDGLIKSIDEPIANYLPEWASDPRGKITIRNLLNMSAGLETYHDSNNPENKATRLFFGSDSTTPIFDYPAVEAPGNSFAYSYMIPELEGLVLERALKGRRYVDYLSEKLWKPVGNGDAAVWLDRPGGRPHFNASLFASAEDWLNIGKLILDNGRVGGRQIVPASWIATMKTPSAVNPNYGMMWLGRQYVPERRFAPNVAYVMKSSAPYLASDVVLLDGYGGQRVYIVPSKKLVIVRIGTTQRDWDDAVVPNAILRGLR